MGYWMGGMNFRTVFFLVAPVGVLGACGPEPAVETDLQDRAVELARNALVADGHIDIPAGSNASANRATPINEQRRAHPIGTIDDVVAHIDHIVGLVRALLQKGYTEADITKIPGGNLVHVWTEVERQAAPTP